MRIWFNRAYATYYHLVRELSTNRTIVGTHVDPTSPFLQACDERFSELTPSDADGYVEEALIFCQTQGIDVFWPTLHQEHVVREQHRFEAEGVRLVTPGVTAVDSFGSKSQGYATAAQIGLVVPAHRVVHTRDEFMAGWDELKQTHRHLCVKPNTGVGGDGFKVITEAPLSLKAFSSTEAHLVRLDHLLDAMAVTDSFPPQILMAHLPGSEYSIDILSHEGHVYGAYPRRKPRGKRQTELLASHELVDEARTLVEHTRMSGLSNVQFMEDGDGVPRLLEVNTRAAGGIHHWFSTVGNLPEAALQLALGEEPGELEEPEARTVFTVDASVESHAR